MSSSSVASSSSLSSSSAASSYSSNDYQDLACTLRKNGGQCDEVICLGTSPNTNCTIKGQASQTNGPRNRVNINSDGAMNVSAFAGKTVCIEAAQYDNLYVNKVGGSEGSPVTYTNCGGQAVFSTATGSPLSFDTNNYVRLTGTGSKAHQHGIVAEQTKVSSPLQSNHFVVFGKGSSDIEIDHIEIRGVPVTFDSAGSPKLSGGVGIVMETYPDCAGNFSYGKWEMKNIHVHDNSIHDTLNEGMYFGPSHFGIVPYQYFAIGFRPPGCTDKYFYEAAGSNLVVENNTLVNIGNDAIQAGGITGGFKIRKNTVHNFGLNNDRSHSTGIQIGNGSKGIVELNWLETNKPYETQGLKHCGMDGTSYVNNVIIGTRVGIAIECQSDVIMGEPNGTSYFYQNTVLNTSSEIIGVYCERLSTIQMQNNIFSGYSTQFYAPGGTACLSGYASNNIFAPSTNTIKFVNPAGGNYHLGVGSPAIDTGGSLKGIVDVDYNGVDRSTGRYDHGAFNAP